VAHNAPFDQSFCAPDAAPWIDSLRAASGRRPPRHTNQVLRYWLDLEVDAPHPHRGADDTLVTGTIWQRFVETLAVRPDAPAPSLEALAAWIAAPLDLTTVPFGKYKGQPFTALPPDYIRWGLANIEDPDVVNQMRQVQERRHPSAAHRLR
jgi:exodeoxyribonuclease X